MSKYTVELRWIIENEKLFPPANGTLSLKNVLDGYPVYNETYTDPITGQSRNRRDEINNKILNHYYFREIGFETVNMFLFKFNAKMNEIMNYYNQMYKSSDIEFNPLWNVEMHETFTHTFTGGVTTTNNATNTKTLNTTNTETLDTTNTETLNTTNAETATNEGIGVESDTPQTGVTEADIKANTYASKTNHGNNSSTNTRVNTGTNTNETTGTNTRANTGTDTDTIEGETIATDNRTETFTKLTEGSSAGLPYSDAIRQWRNVMVNIDMLIVDELKDLFMNVW